MPNPGRFQPGQSGNPNGRKKGAPNKITRELKEAILAAYEKAGGVAYLTKLALEDPRTFCMLLGKVLPLQLTGDPDAPVTYAVTIKGGLPEALVEDILEQPTPDAPVTIN